jgi:tRNA pseudouridine55 synthase
MPTKAEALMQLGHHHHDDAEGEVLERCPVTAGRDDIEAVLLAVNRQIATYSEALKRDGQPLYKLACG